MSLKRYLMIAFGSLILLFTLMQWLLIQQLAGEFRAQLANRSETVAQQVAEVTIDTLLPTEALPMTAPPPVLAPRAPASPRPESAPQDQARMNAGIEAELERARAHLAQEEQRQQQRLQQQQRQIANITQQLEQPRSQLELEAHESELQHRLHRLQQTEMSIDALNEAGDVLSQQQLAEIRAAAERARDALKQQARQIQVVFPDQQNQLIIKGLGANLAVPLDWQPQQQMLNHFAEQVLLVLLIGALLSLVGVVLLSRKLARPLEQLDEGCQRLSRGELGLQLSGSGTQETRRAIDTFNHMSTELKRNQDQQQQFQQRRHLAELGEITRGIAHALRNPLHTIGLLLDGLPPEQESLKRQIAAKLEHLDTSLSALLTLSSSGLDRTRKVRLFPLVEEIRLELSQTRHPVSFDNQLPEHLAVTGAEIELRTILHTLMANAQQASQPGQAVCIHTRHRQGRRLIWVEDQGCGLSNEIRPHLFEPHQTTKPEGAGMGLYIARRIARLWYQGDIVIEEQPRGLRVGLALPEQKDTP
ncbi:Signal transduction histidine kinase [Ferrimonas sediminum]|uniref:histidine kinase n=1 Tax=Ferrimonas sediminum TaxID=718193 RepID=A0A1G8LV20_9GAMM|nr:HAMP domain-containing sensor histidine kinase [Ferrimonas sediminum]SDI59327.1 Signal transduction histidine kinase [Ferrimonas sediminum]